MQGMEEKGRHQMLGSLFRSFLYEFTEPSSDTKSNNYDYDGNE